MEPQPFFATAAVEHAPRRAMLVTYSYPPDRNVGALRWQKLTRFFVERGWAVDVVTIDPAYMAKQDPSSLADLPPGVRIYGIPHPPLALQRMQRAALSARRWLRGRLASGRSGSTAAVAAPASTEPVEETVRTEDVLRAGITLQSIKGAYHARMEHAHYARWGRAAAAVGRRLAQAHRYDAVITTGPPHIAHEAGRLISRAEGIPLVVDFRDPWSLRARILRDVASKTSIRLAREAERRVVEAAELIVLNTEPLHDAMRNAHPAQAARMLTIMNGADDEDLPRVERSARFTLAFAGSIYLDRNPRVLFQGLRRVVTELGLTPDDLLLEMIGHVESFSGVSTRAMADEEGVGPFVRLGPGVSRDAALAFLSRAHLLVTLPQDSRTQVPAKLFEYTNFDAWLLVHAASDSATARTLAGTEADVVGIDDVEGTAAAIRRRFLEHRAGALPRPINADGRFSRAVQAARLLDALEARLGSRSEPPSRSAPRPTPPAEAGSTFARGVSPS